MTASKKLVDSEVGEQEDELAQETAATSRANFRRGIRWMVGLILAVACWDILWACGVWPTSRWSSGVEPMALIPGAACFLPLITLLAWEVVEWFAAKRNHAETPDLWSVPALMLCGVVLPAMAAGLMWLPWGAAAFALDFFSGILQGLLVTVIPVGNRIVWSSILRNDRQISIRVWLLMGISLGVSFAYAAFDTLVCAKIGGLSFDNFIRYGFSASSLGDLLEAFTHPPAVIFLMAVTTPLLAFGSSIILLRRLLARWSKSADTDHWRYAVVGALLALFSIFGPGLPHTFNRLMVAQVSGTDSTSEHARAKIRLLRALASPQAFLEDCYTPALELGAWVWYIARGGNPPYVSVEAMRDVYYRVYGRSFNSSPMPLTCILSFLMRDENRGFQEVGAKQTGLSLSQSNLQASVDANAAVCYLEWTFEFKNDSLQQREARTQIALPPKAVVSRAALWVRGRERVAAITGRSMAARAYQAIVAQRRDPLLVTYAGQDRVLLQCFPVEPRSEMKVKLGITIPAVVDEGQSCHVVLPMLTESNFSSPASNEITVTANGEPSTTFRDQLKAEQLKGGLWNLTGTLSDEILQKSNAVIHFQRTGGESYRCWAQDPVDSHHQFFLEQVHEHRHKVPSQVVVLIDGASSVAPYKEELAKALASVPAGLNVSILCCSDEMSPLADRQSSILGVPYSAAAPEEIRALNFAGGPNNWPYLTAAWHKLLKKKDGVIIWIHGPQPSNPPQHVAGVSNWWWYEPSANCPLPGGDSAPEFYDVEVARGVNRVREMCQPGFYYLDAPRIISVNRQGALDQDLKTLFEKLAGLKPEFKVSITREVERPDAAKVSIPGANAALATLWARNDAEEQLFEGHKQQAADESVEYGIVGPATSAVVLETLRDYKDAGIKPPASKTSEQSNQSTTWFAQAPAGITGIDFADQSVESAKAEHMPSFGLLGGAEMQAGQQLNALSSYKEVAPAPCPKPAATKQAQQQTIETPSTAIPKLTTEIQPGGKPEFEEPQISKSKWGSNAYLVITCVINVLALAGLAVGLWMVMSKRQPAWQSVALMFISILVAIASTWLSRLFSDFLLTF